MNTDAARPRNAALYCAICFLWLILLAGCSLHPREPAAVVSSNPQQLYALRHWQLRGKLGLRLPDQSGSALLTWKQSGDDFDIFLSGPLGRGSTRITAQGGTVSMQTDESTVSAGSPEELMQQTLGWWLPVSNLHYWIRGVAVPDLGIAAITRNADLTLASLDQSGWLVAYDSYQAVPPYLLPERVTVERGDIRATLVIKQWQLQP